MRLDKVTFSVYTVILYDEKIGRVGETMKKYIQKIILIIFSIVLIVSGCASNDEEIETTYNEMLEIYLKDMASTELVSLSVENPYDKTADQVTYAFLHLKEGVEDSEALPTVPQNVKLKKQELIDAHLKLYLSSDYEQLTKEEELICRTSIVHTLTAIKGIETVEFYVEELPLKGIDGSLIGKLSRKDVVIDFGTAINERKQQVLTLYYPDEEARGLVPVEVTIDVNPNKQIEKTIIELLMTPPEGLGVISLIPEGTVIKSITTTANICIVDFNETFKTDHIGGSSSELYTIYSIVNSLTELTTIKKVQFMIDGKLTEMFKGHMKFDELFERNLDIIYKAE